MIVMLYLHYAKYQGWDKKYSAQTDFVREVKHEKPPECDFITTHSRAQIYHPTFLFNKDGAS